MKGPYDTGRFAEAGDLGSVDSHVDVAQVIERMLSDLLTHPDEWENPTLARFLEALAASLEGLPGLYANRGEDFPEVPTWKIFAEALVMATGYERGRACPRRGPRAPGRRRQGGVLCG